MGRMVFALFSLLVSLGMLMLLPLPSQAAPATIQVAAPL